MSDRRIPGLLEPDHKGILRYTATGLLPFTTHDDDVRCVDNIFCKGQVASERLSAGFVGWIVQGQRPLAEHEVEPGIWVVGYGAAGTIFKSYRDAIDACVATFAYADRRGYDWLAQGKFRIFSVAARKAAAAPPADTGGLTKKGL